MVLPPVLEERNLLSAKNPERTEITPPKPTQDHPWRIWNKRKGKGNKVPAYSLSSETSGG